jgi:hypothetical protein
MKNEKFYSAFGVLTVAFSRMEADLRMLIAGIAFDGNAVVASAFLDSSQLNENIKILRKLSRRSWEEEDQLLEIAKAAEAIRETRNLFIHGIWLPNSFGEPDGFATVTDIRTTFERDEEKRSWSHSQTKRFSLSDFQKVLDSVIEISDKIEKACNRFESEKDIKFCEGGLTASLKPIQVPLSTVMHKCEGDDTEI